MFLEDNRMVDDVLLISLDPLVACKEEYNSSEQWFNFIYLNICAVVV